MVPHPKTGVPTKVARVDRYKWVVKDKPGELRYLDKRELRIAPEYQRQVFEGKVLSMAAKWSWTALGAIIVGYRDGQYWVIDGQHRVSAAMRRQDIKDLPCVVFETDDISQEAQGFLDVNTGRKGVTTIDKYRALIVAGDATAIYLQNMFERLNIEPKRGFIRGAEITSVGWAISRAQESPADLETTLELAAEMCRDTDLGLTEKLIAGLYYIQRQVMVPDKLEDRRLRARIKQIGPVDLVSGASKAAAYFAHGGAKIWATGMLDQINHGLQKKFDLAPSVLHRLSTEKS